MDRPLIAILLVGAAVRAAYLLELSGSPEVHAPVLDAAFHDFWAKALLSGDWTPPEEFADPQIHTSPYFRPPGYPYALALLYAVTGGQPLLVRALQMMLSLGNVLLVHRIGLRLGGTQTARLGALLAATYWAMPYFEGELLAPSLLVGLLLGSLLAFVRWRESPTPGRAIACGLLVGAATLVRPNSLLVGVALSALAWSTSRRLCREPTTTAAHRGHAWLLPACMLLAILPATLRNFAVAGEFVPVTSNAGVNLYIGNNPESDGHSPGIPVLDDLAPLAGWTCFDQPALVRGVEVASRREMSAGAVSRWFAGKATEYAAQHPLQTIGRLLYKAGLFVEPAEIGNNREVQLVREHSPVLRLLPRWPLLLSLALVGIAAGLRRSPVVDDARSVQRDVVVLLLVAGFVWVASHLPFFVTARYRVPLAAILMPLAGLGAAKLWSLAGTPGRRLLPVATWIALLATLSWHWSDYEPDVANFHLQRAEAKRRTQDLTGARESLQQALAAMQTPKAPIHNNLGAVLLQLGDFRPAREQLERAVALAPRYADARHNLGLLLANVGDDAAACEQLETTLQLDPSRHRARAQLGGLRLRLGQPDLALPHLQQVATARPDDTRTRYLLALARLETGATAAAAEELASLLADEAVGVAAHVTLADIRASAGATDEARRLLNEARRRDPTNRDAARLLEQLR